MVQHVINTQNHIHMCNHMIVINIMFCFLTTISCGFTLLPISLQCSQDIFSIIRMIEVYKIRGYE